MTTTDARKRLAEKSAAAQPTPEVADSVHALTIKADDGGLTLGFECTAAPGAPCRRRPTDDSRESWSLDDPDLVDGDCWAFDWFEAVGPEGIWSGEDMLGRVPVSISFDDEQLMLDPVDPQPVLPTAALADGAES